MVRTIAAVALDTRLAARGALCVLRARRRRHSEGDVATFTKIRAFARQQRGTEPRFRFVNITTCQRVGWVSPRALCLARACASALAPMPTRRVRRAGGAIPDPAPAGDSSAERGKPTRGGPSPGNASARASSTPARSRGGVAVAVAWALWALLGAFVLRDARRVPIHGCAPTPPTPFPDRDGIPPRVPTHPDPRDDDDPPD